MFPFPCALFVVGICLLLLVVMLWCSMKLQSGIETGHGTGKDGNADDACHNLPRHSSKFAHVCIPSEEFFSLLLDCGGCAAARYRPAIYAGILALHTPIIRCQR